MTARISRRAIQSRPGRVRWLGLVAVLFAAWASAAAPGPEIRPWSVQEAPLAPHLVANTWTLVMFWSVTCGICAAETPALNAFYQDERKKTGGVQLLGVSIDGPGLRTEVERWMTRFEMGFPTLLGELPGIAGYFSAATKEPFRGTPTFMIFNPQGQLVGVNPGPVRVAALKKFIARKEKGQ